MKRTLYSRLTKIILCSVLIMLLSVGYSFFSFYEYNINEQANAYTKQLLEDSADELNTYFDDISQSGTMLANQPVIAEFMAGTTSKRFALTSTTRAQITSFANFKPTVTGIYLLTTDGTRISAKPDNVEAYSAEIFMAFLEIVQTNDLTTPTREIRISDPCRGAQYFSFLIPVYRSVAAAQSSDYLGTMVVICESKRLASIIPPSARDRVIILDESGEIIYGRENAEAAEQKSLSAGGRSRGEMQSAQLAKPNWTLLATHSDETVIQRINEMGAFCILVAVLTVIVQFILLVALRRSFVQPLEDIARQAGQINRSGESIHNPLPSSSEFTLLTESINGMFERIEALNNENLSVKTDYYKERILLLQMQINPHFLYNNLECIRGMAVLGHENEIREIVSLTASIYRYCTSAEHMVPLSQELECVSRYAKIMTLRYDNRYAVSFDVPEELLEAPVPKMLLQPLVENAYTHGFIATNKREGSIIIRAWETGTQLFIAVEDDGTGLSPEELRHANTATLKIDDVREHIGVANVRSRLRLIFGENGVLQFKEREGGGTVALVIIGKPFD